MNLQADAVVKHVFTHIANEPRLAVGLLESLAEKGLVVNDVVSPHASAVNKRFLTHIAHKRLLTVVGLHVSCVCRETETAWLDFFREMGRQLYSFTYTVRSCCVSM